MPKIDLALLTKGEVASLSGHPRGIAAREFFGLDNFDKSNEPIVVVVPDNLDAITPSFVQGMFAKSVHRLGEEGFFKHYRFELPSYLLTDVRLGVQRALMRRELAGAA